MATSVTTANAILDAEYGSGSPATHYIALYTDMPDADGVGGTEVSGGSYARKAVTNNNTNWPAAVDRVKSNGAAIDFVTATANWGSVVGVGIFTASSGGTLKDFAELDTARTVNNGDAFSIAVTQLNITQG